MLHDALNRNDRRGAAASAEAKTAPALIRRMLLGSFFVAAATLVILLLSGETFAQDVEAHKRGVVRIHNTRLNVTGTGFIVRIDRNRAYVVTAAHVVRGDAQPDVYFFNRPHDPVQGKLINREDNDDLKGLAFLRVQAGADVLRGLTALRLSTSSVKGGEAVSIIGFPDGTDQWSVTRGTISRLEGREMVFTGPIRTGNSGGPVLLGGQVIGMVTDTIQESGYASQTANIEIYIKGIDPETANSLKLSAAETGAGADSPDRAPFCRALSQIVAASHDNFYSIVKSNLGGGRLYEPSITLPGMSGGHVYPEAGNAYFITLKDEYYNLISKVRQCLRNWKQESPEVKSSLARIPDQESQRKKHIFTEGDKGTVIEISILKYGATTGTSTFINIYAPDSPLNPKRLQRLSVDSSESILDVLGDQEKVGEICRAIRKIADAGQDGFFSLVGKQSAYWRGQFDLNFDIPGLPEGRVKPRDRVEFILVSLEGKEFESVYYHLSAAMKSCLQGWRSSETQTRFDPNSYSYQFFDDEKGSVVEIYASKISVRLTIYSPSSTGKPK